MSVETRIIEMKIIEMRTYKLKPGKRSEFLEIFRSKSIPAHAEIGMKILGPFLSLEDPDTFFFMRGFPDLASREPMKAKFYEGELWQRELENLLMPILDKYDGVLAEDREGLVRWQEDNFASLFPGVRTCVSHSEPFLHHLQVSRQEDHCTEGDARITSGIVVAEIAEADYVGGAAVAYRAIVCRAPAGRMVHQSLGFGYRIP